MKTFLRILAVMSVGAFFYGATELAGRGFTHITMGLLGGVAFLVIHTLNGERRRGRIGLLTGAVISGLFITSCELLAGEVLNVRLGMRIWSYRELPLNFDGQICGLFSFFWLILSLVGFMADELLRKYIFKEKSVRNNDEHRAGRRSGQVQAQRL